MRVRAILAVSVCWAISAQATEVQLQATGADQGLRDSLRAASVAVSAAAEPDATPQDLLAAARADYSRLIGVLYGRGYYSPVIHIRVDGREAAVIPGYDAPTHIGKISLTVEPGPQFTFSQAMVGPLARGTLLPDGFRIGQTARSGLIQSAAQSGLNGWRDAGHAKARIVSQRIVADHRAHTLAADITLDPGARLSFGDLIVTGDSRVRTERILAIAGLPVGATYTPGALEKAASRLRRTGAFRSVVLSEAETPNPDGTLDITASVVDEKPRRIGAGIEVSSLEGLTLSTYWLHRNLLHGAERFRFDAEVGGIGGTSGGVDTRLGVSLTRPAAFGPDTSLTFRGMLEDLNEPDYSEQNAGVGVALTRQFTDALSASAGVRFQHTEVNDDLGSRSFDNLLFPFTATWDKRDDILNPAHGVYVDTALEPFLGSSGSAPGARLAVDVRGYHGIGPAHGVVLAGRLQMGSVLGAGISEVPPDMLFFSGGGGTVRGQPYQSLGVTLSGGESLGGRSFLGLSAELRVAVSDTIGLVGFTDAGLVGADSLPGSNGNWQAGAGIGVRYYTSLGAIRMDVAAPVGGGTGSGVQIYVGIGQAF